MFGLAETRIQHLECNSEAANFIQFLLMKIWISWNSLDPSGTRRFKLTQGTQVNKSRFGTCCFFLSWFRWYADRFTHLLSLKSARASSVNLPLPPSHDLRSSCSFPSQLFPRKFRTKPPKTGKFHHPPPPIPIYFEHTTNPIFQATAPDAPNGQSLPHCHGLLGVWWKDARPWKRFTASFGPTSSEIGCFFVSFQWK